MAWSVDRLGRSLRDLVVFLSEIDALKVDLYLHQQGIDTTTPSRMAMPRRRPNGVSRRRADRRALTSCKSVGRKQT